MTNHTAGTTHTGPGTGPDAAVAALVAAVEVFIKTLSGGVPFGGGAYVLERVKVVREQMDQLTFAMLAPLAQMESSGELLEAGGQKSLKAYLTHAWGIPHGEAERLMFLAQNLHNHTLPQTTAALEEGTMTVGEAAAIASGAEREVNKRDAHANPDADHYRSRIDTGLAGLKAQRPATSVKTLTSTAHALGLELNPDRPEKNEEREFAERGARLYTSCAGFTFEAWGPASDGERLKVALASFTAAYGTTNANGVGTNGALGEDGAGAAASGGTGNAGDSDLGLGLIPAGESVTSRYARTYDALICAAGFAHSHHGHTDGVADASGFAGGEADGTATGDPAGDGFASGRSATGPATAVVAGSSAAADSGAGGTAPGGSCSQPPGTKAIINITVPLSALLDFGFAFNNETDANSVNAPGATGSPPGSGAGSCPDPGGGATDADTTTAFSTGPPGTTPSYADASDNPGAPRAPGAAPAADLPGSPANPGALACSGVAVTEDGHVLALSAVRAMAPTAQIRRLIFDDRTGLPLDLGRAHRLAPGYLRTAAFVGHTTCAWSGGCDVPVSQCEADHITEFTHGGATTATNLQPLCSTHNRLKYRRSRTENTPNGTAGAPGA